MRFLFFSHKHIFFVVFFMPAADTAELKVWMLVEGLLNQLVVVSELDDLWRRFDVNITSAQEYQVRLSLYKLI